MPSMGTPQTKLRLLRAGVVVVGLAVCGSAQAAVDQACTGVSFANLGWTEIELATTTARQILEELGYDTSWELLGLGVAYEGLKNGDIDVFMGSSTRTSVWA
jgi:glycine betaine/proline transport system substrate-binding protein